MRMTTLIASLVLASGIGTAHAEICDYRLSELASRAVSSVTSRGERTESGETENAPSGNSVSVSTGGFQIVIQSSGGGGSSRALGRIGSASGLLGTASSIAGSPATMMAAGSALIGAVGLQVGCHFRDERINDYHETLVVLRRVATDMPPEVFQLVEPVSDRQIAFIRVLMEHGEPLQEFDVRRLMIVNGRLVHRDFGPNTVIGDIAVFLPQTDDE